MRKYKPFLPLLILIGMVYIISGPPGQGKTFFATSKALKLLKEKKLKVFSNYPILLFENLTLYDYLKNAIITLINCLVKIHNRIFPNKTKNPIEHKKPILLDTSYIWLPEYMVHGLHDSVVFIDEAYRYFSSRNFKQFSVDTHTTFATNRHNTTDYYLIAQHPDRLDVIIREITSVFYNIKKISIPFNGSPLLFIINGFDKEDHYDSYRLNRNEDLLYSKDYLLPRNKIKKAYDTHFFKTNTPLEEYKKWA